MTRLLRWIAATPLAQFILIGAAVTALYAVFSPAGAPRKASREVIVVEEARIAQFAAQFERTWRRQPTRAERAGIVDAFIREEILYRAGLALSLEQDDPVIRRRIAQKMEFLLEPGPGEIEIDDEALAAHLRTNPERFRRPARIAFRQILIDPARAPDGLDAAVAALRAELEAGTPAVALGAPTMLPTEFGLAPLREVARAFGDEFAAALGDLQVGTWAGPVPSGFGLHLVRVDKRTAPRDPPLEEVRDAVLRDLEAERRAALAEERFEKLRSGYEISVPAITDGRQGPDADTAAELVQ